MRFNVICYKYLIVKCLWFGTNKSSTFWCPYSKENQDIIINAAQNKQSECWLKEMTCTVSEGLFWILLMVSII